MKKSIFRPAIFLTLLMLMFSPKTLADEPGSSITFGIQSTKTIVIRPLEPVERDMLSVYHLVYESVVQIDDDYLPQPNLAESWTVSGNGSTWTFHLRHDAVFSDGTPLTAGDVVASAQYILDKANDENISDHGFYANLKYFVSSIKAEDDYTVVVKTPKGRPYYGLLYEMTFPVVPAACVNADSPPGTGPYMILEFHPGERMWLSANPNWWKATPQIRDINFVFHDTSRSVVESYEYARVDGIFTRSIAGAQYKTGTSSVALRYRTNQLECLLLNNSSSELTTDVRKAIRYLIDKSQIVSNVYSGLAQETNFPFYPGTWMYNDSMDSLFVRDVEKARELLAAEGWEDSDENGILDKMTGDGKLRSLSLRFYYYEEPDNDVRAETVNLIVDALAEVGIACRVEPMTMANLRERLSSGNYDLALVSYAMDTCPDPGFLLMPANTGNYFRYRSEKMDTLCKSLRTQVTMEGYRQKLMEIQSLFYEDCPFICLYWRMGTVASRYMYTTRRDVREYELLRGIESYFSR